MLCLAAARDAGVGSSLSGQHARGAGERRTHHADSGERPSAGAGDTADRPVNGMIHPLEIREAQTAALSIRNTGMAVTDDVGNVGDNHPTNKQEVGRRLSLWAPAKTYGQPDLGYCGPSYRSMAKRDAAVVPRFDHADGLMTRAAQRQARLHLVVTNARF